jgi:hypothetical protein
LAGHASNGPNDVLGPSIEETKCFTGGGRCPFDFGLSAACNDSCCTLPATHTAIQIIAASGNATLPARTLVQKRILFSTTNSVAHYSLRRLQGIPESVDPLLTAGLQPGAPLRLYPASRSGR